MPQFMSRPKGLCQGSSCPGCSSANCYAKGGSISELGTHSHPDWADPEPDEDEDHEEPPMPLPQTRMKHEKGVNSPGYGDRGASIAGGSVRAGQMDTAKNEHGRVLHQLKGMKKPHLYAEGGEIHGSMHMGHEDAHEDHEAMDSELGDMMGEELMSAFESKDKKRIMESIEAMVLHCMNKE